MLLLRLDNQLPPKTKVLNGYMAKSKYLATCSRLSPFCKSKSPNIDDFSDEFSFDFNDPQVLMIAIFRSLSTP